MDPKISVILCSFNDSRILRALDSFYGQDWANKEAVVIDGGSSDNLVNDIRSRLSDQDVLVSEPDDGIYDALNKGLSRATGDIIGILHADDIYYDNEVLSQVSKCFISRQVDYVYGNLVYVDALGKVVRQWVSTPITDRSLNAGDMPAHPTLYLSRHAVERIGRYSLDYGISADYDFMIRLLKDGMLVGHQLDKMLTKMEVGGASNRSLKALLRKIREDYRIIEKNHLSGWLTLAGKNLGKLPQLVMRRRD